MESSGELTVHPDYFHPGVVSAIFAAWRTPLGETTVAISGERLTHSLGMI